VPDTGRYSIPFLTSALRKEFPSQAHLIANQWPKSAPMPQLYRDAPGETLPD
jgi:hypothetical protein